MPSEVGVTVTVWDVDEPRELEPGADLSAEPGTAAEPPGACTENPDTVARLLAEFREEWAPRHLRDLPIRPGFLGVFAPEVDKGDALRFPGRAPGRCQVACGDGEADATLLSAAAVRIAVGEEPHELGHLEDVVVTGWARLPTVLRAQVLPLL